MVLIFLPVKLEINFKIFKFLPKHELESSNQFIIQSLLCIPWPKEQKQNEFLQ